MTKDIQKALELGKVKGAKVLLANYYKQEHKSKWMQDKQAEYDGIYPLFIYIEDVVTDVKETYEQDGYVVFDEYIDKNDIQKYSLQKKIEYITVDEEGAEVRTPAEYLTFNEWLNETVVVTEAVEAEYDDEGVVLVEAVEEVTELVRPYVADTEDNIQAKVDTYLVPYNTDKQIAEAQEYLNTTDMYMTIDKYAQLDDVTKSELETKREEARAVIRKLRDGE